MKLIKPSTEIIPQQEGLLGVYKQIELAGRVAYKSEDKITNDSAEKFVNMLIERKHYRPLEFGTIYLKLPTNINPEKICFYDSNHWSRWTNDDEYYYVTTNARVIVENELQDDLKYICEPEDQHYRRITARVISSRGIIDEARTHIAFSHLAESTRYCNYSKDRFDNNVSFIIPRELNIESGIYSMSDLNFGKDIPMKFKTLLQSYSDAEHNYFHLLNAEGFAPQDARNVLPLGVKSELMTCGYEDDWDHFFAMRCDVAAHPDMQLIANELKKKICR